MKHKKGYGRKQKDNHPFKSALRDSNNRYIPKKQKDIIEMQIMKEHEEMERIRDRVRKELGLDE